MKRLKQYSQLRNVQVLTKCAEVAARGELDFDHIIPRGMYNRLASEFQRISGARVKRLMD